MNTKILLAALVTSGLLASSVQATLVTFEAGQGYALGNIGVLNPGGLTNAPFTGQQGWSLSTSNGTGAIAATVTSGEYIAGRALFATATTNATYIGGKLGIVEPGLFNTITFDANYDAGGAITAGFLGDGDLDGLFDNATDPGMQFGGHGPSGSTVYYRDAGFGTNQTIPGVTGTLTAGQWFRHTITIGEVIGLNRSITMSVRNLTLAADLDLNGASAGNSISFSVANSTFGVAPAAAVGGFVRISDPIGGLTPAIDNLLFTFATAEIAVSGNSIDIANNDNTPSLADFTDFGVTTVGSPIQKTFRVDNSGGVALSTSGLTLPAGFSLIEGLSGSINSLGFDTFTVQLNAAAVGTYSGNISFTNNDSNESPFNFAITGVVVPEPSSLALLLFGSTFLWLVRERNRN